MWLIIYISVPANKKFIYFHLLLYLGQGNGESQFSCTGIN